MQMSFLMNCKAWILRSVFYMTTRLALNTVNSLLIMAKLLAPGGETPLE